MRITIFTLFPHVFSPLLHTSIFHKAAEKGAVEIALVNIRDFAIGRYKGVDDKPYGGGVGMILRVDVLYKALARERKGYRILLAPTGKRYTQADAKRLCAIEHLVLICGHYEGFDARIESHVDEIISIGDFILTGGEIAAMVIIDSVVRLLPGVLPPQATKVESFEQGLLEYPQYTRPKEFRGQKVPEILLSGNHQKIEKWRSAAQKRVESNC